MMTAKAIAAVHGPAADRGQPSGRPRAYAAADGRLAFPYLLLLVSGGHCELLSGRRPRAIYAARRHTRRCRRRSLRQDGETAWPALSRGAGGGTGRPERGPAARFAFPRPMRGRDDCDFSFSGLKTAVVPHDRGSLPGATLSESGRRGRRRLVPDCRRRGGSGRPGAARHRPGSGLEHGPNGALVVAGGVAAKAAQCGKAWRRMAGESGFRVRRAAPRALHGQRRHDRLGR